MRSIYTYVLSYKCIARLLYARMDRLQQLASHVTKEANDQAADILNLMAIAHQQNKDHILYTPTPPAKAIHPLVNHTLISKGYKVELAASPPPVLGGFSTPASTLYKISL